MATLVEERKGIVPPPAAPHGRGGDGGGDDSRSSFPISKGQVGVWILLTAIIMLFAGLSSAYIVLRGVPSWQNIELPSLLWPNTAILLLSSVAMEISRRALKNYALIGPAFKDDGSPVSPSALDERSVPFGITSLSYSHATSDISWIWRHLWASINGDMRGTPFVGGPPPEKVQVPPRPPKAKRASKKAPATPSPAPQATTSPAPRATASPAPRVTTSPTPQPSPRTTPKASPSPGSTETGP